MPILTVVAEKAMLAAKVKQAVVANNSERIRIGASLGWNERLVRPEAAGLETGLALA